MDKASRKLERIVRGFASQHRIQILDLLESKPDSGVTVARACGLNVKTASAHVRVMALTGLLVKKPQGLHVLLTLSPRGKSVLKFLRTLDAEPAATR
jgi:predicted transcriptional regulator